MKTSKKPIGTGGSGQTKPTQGKAIHIQPERPCASGGMPDGLEAWKNFSEIVDDSEKLIRRLRDLDEYVAECGDAADKIEKLQWCVNAVLKSYDHNSGEPFKIGCFWIDQAEQALRFPSLLPKNSDA